IAKVFRDGPLKKGRMREFYQCDGDVIGQEGQEIEGELLSLFYTTYKALGIDVVLELNNNKILRGSLLEFGANEEDLSSYILSIDKLKKIQKEGVLKEIEEKNLDTQICSSAIDLLSSKSIDILKESSSNELLKEGVNELSTLVTLLDFQKVPYRLNFSLSRGLDIYTGNIWESYDLSESVTSSLGAGGRYDKVIGEYMALTKGNKEVTEFVPAVGISFGLVPIMSVLESKEDSSQKEGLTTTLIVPLSQDCVSKGFQIADKFRNENINTEMFYGYSMKKAFKYCDYLGVENIVILGEKDIEKNTYVLKNLKSKEETIFSL
ncbi:MAG: ATP phosphoribosyltransferase regulatory subunit, partial [Nanoarchaeota archaeon]|nr:ATP phosphoribosyltransferase regulatory subunit [Nanoarchaeota archaeon]